MPRINGKTSMMNHSDTKNSRDIKNLNMNINNTIACNLSQNDPLFYLYYSLYIKEEYDNTGTLIPSYISSDFVTNSSFDVNNEDSQTLLRMTDSNYHLPTSDIKMYIKFRGTRFPDDAAVNELDDDGNLVIRGLKASYYEEYEISAVKDNNTIGSMSGALMYLDSASAFATSIDQAIFPISNSSGIFEDLNGGKIVWNFKNELPYKSRVLEMYGPISKITRCDSGESINYNNMLYN